MIVEKYYSNSTEDEEYVMKALMLLMELLDITAVNTYN